jgi:DNA mismatch repair protein MSH6
MGTFPRASLLRMLADSEQAKSKKMSYAESESEGVDDDDDIFKPAPKTKNTRPTKRRKMSESTDEDTYEAEGLAEEGRYIISF